VKGKGRTIQITGTRTLQGQQKGKREERKAKILPEEKLS
jgi:hypothetical protein